jgi:hypothetical protein
MFSFGIPNAANKPADATAKATDPSKPVGGGFALGAGAPGPPADATKPAIGGPGVAVQPPAGKLDLGAAAKPAGVFDLGGAAKPAGGGLPFGIGAAAADPAKKAAEPAAALNPAALALGAGAVGAAAGALVPAPAVAPMKEVTADEMMKGKTINQLIAAWYEGESNEHRVEKRSGRRIIGITMLCQYFCVGGAGEDWVIGNDEMCFFACIHRVAFVSVITRVRLVQFIFSGCGGGGGGDSG